MAIQHVAGSGSSNGIMSFLFQDDAGMDGTVLDGAEFAKTLHHLLGEHESNAATPLAAPALHDGAALVSATDVALAQLAAPASAACASPTADLTVPEPSAKQPLATRTHSEDGNALEQPFWSHGPFADMLAALPATTVAAAEPADETQAAPDAAAAVPETFGNGIHHVIELARALQESALQLSQQPAPQVVLAGANAGKDLPVGGKVLPQGFRPLSLALTQAAGATQAKQLRVALNAETLPLTAANDATAAATLNDAIAADLAGAAPRSQPQASSFAQTLAPVIQAARVDQAGEQKPFPATSAAEATPPLQSAYTAGSAAWFEDLGTRVEWLRDMNIEKAELQLHPAELGLLEIQIETGAEGTTVAFVTHNPEARELIEESLPRLRELLASQGMQLGDSHVSQHSGERGRPAPAGTAVTPDTPATADAAAPERHRVYLADPNRIDHYV